VSYRETNFAADNGGLDIRRGGIGKGTVNAGPRRSGEWQGSEREREKETERGREREREREREKSGEGGTIVEICMNRSRLFGRGMSTPPQEK